MKNYLWLLMGLIFAIAIDQGSKHLATEITLNTGVSFGFFTSSFLTMGLILVLAGVITSFGKQAMAVSPLATGLFIGGSLSNLADRIVYGGVRDFLPVPILSVRNNLADWCIILSLLWILWKSTNQSSTKTTRSSSSINPPAGS